MTQGLRFPRSARLLTQGAFRSVFSAPQRSADQWFTVLARVNEDSRARLGLAIARKSARRAVDRNRLKRLARESFRHHAADMGGLDVVVMARPAAITATNAELSEALARHWRRLVKRCGTC